MPPFENFNPYDMLANNFSLSRVYEIAAADLIIQQHRIELVEERGPVSASASTIPCPMRLTEAA
jgi:hypothetical protein